MKLVDGFKAATKAILVALKSSTCAILDASLLWYMVYTCSLFLEFVDKYKYEYESKEQYRDSTLKVKGELFDGSCSTFEGWILTTALSSS